MATFTETPSYSSNVSHLYRTLDATFGDGYEQSTFDGINYKVRMYSLSFNARTCAEGDTVMDFFDTNNTATTSFTWVPPDGVSGEFKCKDPKQVYSSSLCDISCTFTEVFF